MTTEKRLGYADAKRLMKQLANNHPGTIYTAFLDPDWKGYGFYIVCDLRTYEKLYRNCPMTYTGRTNFDGTYHMAQTAA